MKSDKQERERVATSTQALSPLVTCHSSLLHGRPFQSPAIGSSPSTPSEKTMSANPFVFEFLRRKSRSYKPRSCRSPSPFQSPVIGLSPGMPVREHDVGEPGGVGVLQKERAVRRPEHARRDGAVAVPVAADAHVARDCPALKTISGSPVVLELRRKNTPLR